MKYLSIRNLIFAVTITLIVSLAYGLDYSYLTDQEITVFGERVRLQTGDTLCGIIRSNSAFEIMGDPVFCGRIITSAPDFIHGAGYSPRFWEHPPIFNAPLFPFPENMTRIRHLAQMQGQVFSPPPHHYCVLKFSGSEVTIYTSRCGVPFDSTNHQTVQITDDLNIFFFDCPIRVKGLVTGQVVVATNSDINIDGDIRYSDADSLTGITPTTSSNYLALAAMQNIMISNTVVNGRENSHGLGRQQTDRNFASVVITAALYALGGSLTFENQNDPDSGYDYGSTDERGTMYIYGGVVQHRRGYYHRSNRLGTGYLKQIRWDPRLPSWYDGILFEEVPSVPDTVDLGNIPIGIITRDTVHVVEGVYGLLGAVSASTPFHAQRIEPYLGTSFRVPVSITPTQPIEYHGILTVITEYHTYQIVLRARGVPPHSPELTVNADRAAHSDQNSMNASPNPFNLSTRIEYQIDQAGFVSLRVFNILGQQVATLVNGTMAQGSHAVTFEATDLPSGLYICRMETAGSVDQETLVN